MSTDTWEPREYQKRAIKLLVSQGAAGLFLDPGMGKTSSVLAAFKILKDKGLVERMLLVAPLLPCYSTWPGEIEKWTQFNHLTYSIIHGENKEYKWRENTDIHIINPEGLLWYLNDVELPDYDVLCIDESTKFKNSQAKRFKLLRKIVHKFPRRWILTGTPSPRSIEDLFAQIYILDQGASLGQYVTKFRNTYMHQPNPYQKFLWAPRPGAYEKIADLISPLVLRLKAEDWLEMPPLTFNDILVDLPDEARRIYREVEKHYISLVDQGNVLIAQGAAAAGNKCRQIANGGAYKTPEEYIPLHDAKMEALADLLEELNGQPALLVYEFVGEHDRIQKAYPEAYSLRGTKGLNSKAAIDSFNRGEIGILLAHPASAGHGLNMQEECHHVIMFGVTWDLELYDQVIKRVWRQGQKHPVIVHRILARNTMDQTVVQLLEHKELKQTELMKLLADRRKRGFTTNEVT